MTAFPNPAVLIIDTHSCLNDGHSHHHLWGLLTLTVCYTTVWCTCGTWSWLRFSFNDEPERPIVTWQGCNSCLQMGASLVLPLAIPSSLDDLQGKSHLTIYAIFIKKSLNWILLSLISTKSGNSLQHCKSAAPADLSLRMMKSEAIPVLPTFAPLPPFVGLPAGRFPCITHHWPCGAVGHLERRRKVDLGYRLNCSSFFELFP